MPKGRKLNNAHAFSWLTLFHPFSERERGVNQGALWQPVKPLAVCNLTPGFRARLVISVHGRSLQKCRFQGGGIWAAWLSTNARAVPEMRYEDAYAVNRRTTCWE
jgi:hypothetical protein